MESAGVCVFILLNFISKLEYESWSELSQCLTHVNHPSRDYLAVPSNIRTFDLSAFVGKVSLAAWKRLREVDVLYFWCPVRSIMQCMSTTTLYIIVGEGRGCKILKT